MFTGAEGKCLIQNHILCAFKTTSQANLYTPSGIVIYMYTDRGESTFEDLETF